MAEVTLPGCNTLPPHVLAHILSYVPLEIRMRDCACVNSTWHTAAVQGSHSFAVKGLTTTRAAGLAAWLQTYSTAAQVCRLDLQTSNTSTIDHSASAAVGQVLPAMEQLHSVRLQKGWRAAAVAQLSSLHKLQELDLSCHSSVLHAAITTAPTGLTSLVLCRCVYQCSAQLQEEGNPEGATLGQTAWPSLPNLQKLELRDPSVCISFPAVARLPELRTCIISANSIAAQAPPGEGPTGLSALSALTSMQHLDLSGWLAPTCDGRLPALDAADCAALTASTQLTFLSLHKWQLQPELCGAVFPPKRQLPLLRELHLGPCFLQTPAATARVVSAAPGLTVLKVGCSTDQFYSEDHYLEEVAHSVSLDGVQQLQGLECLDLKGVRVEDNSIWDVLARMTQLTELRIQQVSIPCLPGLLQLTTLTNLSSLEVSVVFIEEDEGYCESVCCLTQNPRMGPTTPVFLRLPAQVVKCAAQLCSMATDHEVNAAMPLLLDAAQALFPAALELFWSSEQHWQGVQDTDKQLELSLVEYVDTMQPLVEKLEQSHVRMLELVNTKLAAALAAGCDLQVPQPHQQQQQSQSQALLSGSPISIAEGASDTLVSSWDELWAATRVGSQELGALRSGFEIFRSCMSEVIEISERLGTSSHPFAMEGRRLLAAVQDLKAETRRMCEQLREEDSD